MLCCLLRGAVIYLKMIISKKRNRRRAKNLVIFYNFNGPPNAVSYSLSLSPFHTHQKHTEKHCLCRCFCWWRWFSILTLFFCLCCWWWLEHIHRELYAVSEERCCVSAREREKHFHKRDSVGARCVGWMKSKFSTSRKNILLPLSLSPRALVFCVPLLLLFYYLFYDYLKWPIVKVNDNSECAILFYDYCQ
jgi:hypothetical protein